MTETPTFRILGVVKNGLFGRTVRVEVVSPGVRRNVQFNGAFPNPNWTSIEDRWLREGDVFEGRIEGAFELGEIVPMARLSMLAERSD